MIESSVQFGLLAQGSGFEDWANILFLLVVAVLWLLGALVKAPGRKTPQKTSSEVEGASRDLRQPGETWQARLARRAEELQRRLEEETGLAEPEKRGPPRASLPLDPPKRRAARSRFAPAHGASPSWYTSRRRRRCRFSASRLSPVRARYGEP